MSKLAMPLAKKPLLRRRPELLTMFFSTGQVNENLR
jgi:hypothetical protein